MATIYPIPVNRLLLSFKIATLIFIMAIFSTSCNKQEDFDINELDDLYFNYDKGLLFGLDLGNRWRSVKQSPHKSFTLHDCSSPWYIKQWNPSELLGIAINVDDENNIELFTSTLYVLKKNEQKLISWASNIKKHLTEKIGPPNKKSDKSASWEFKKDNKKATAYFSIKKTKSLINNDSLSSLVLYISYKNY